MNNGFQNIYPFTTETISGYIENMDLKDKKVLTVGSSCDQALNSLLLGASDVTVFDINDKVQYFYELKRLLILSTPREDLVSEVLSYKDFSYSEDIFPQKQLEKMNLYLKNDENYNKLREIIESKDINFITGNVFEIENYLPTNNQYDRVILSNVLQYIPDNKNVYELYEQISKCTTEEALIQLYYLYGTMFPKRFNKILNEFTNNNILLHLVECDTNDSVVFVKSK